MTFDDILEHAMEMLRRRGRVSYRALQRQFGLDDAYLADLKTELITVHRLAVDQDGVMLVWTGNTGEIPGLAAPSPPSDQQRAQQEDHPTAVEFPPAESRMPEAERRQLTVMFCDLVGSTILSERLDPEDLREVVRAYQATCAGVIQRFEGHIAQYLGDGLLVYFGYPQAHEDDAQRAIHTGLGIIKAIGMLNTRLERDQGIRLAVRLGIHTGLVVVGEMGGGGRYELLALGATPNVAARIQGLAQPDTMVITAATYRLVEGYFACHDLGPHTLTGVATPIQVYRVLRESGVQTRLEVATPRGLTPLVGREQELDLLLEHWAKAKDGRGQLVLLSGEAGIGKSRLVKGVKERLAGESHTLLECRCSPYHQNSALYPVIEPLGRVWQFQRDDSPLEKLEKLETALSQYPLALKETVPLLATLFSFSLPENRYPALTLPPQRQKQKTLATIRTVILALAAPRPMLWIIEDLHWIDPSTLELLSLFVDRGVTAPLCTLCTSRPTFVAPWTMQAHITEIALSRLLHAEVMRMVESMTGGKTLPAEVLQQIVSKTDGVPLFVEELTKTVVESGLLSERSGHYELAGPLPPLAIPTTLQDSLMARLDRLDTTKTVAQLGATLGRTFSYELLQAVASHAEAPLQRALHTLVEAELLYAEGIPPQATYMFKHAPIQDVAYQSLLRGTRQHYHQRVAQVLATRFPETAEAQPELLAHHYTEAGLNVQAIGYWQRAGERATQRSANAEAIHHLTKGLEVLGRLPDTPARTQQELQLQVALGTPLMASKGYSAPEVGHAYARARELCQQLGDTPQLFPVLYGLSVFYIVGTDIQTARVLGMQCLRVAQRVQDPGLMLEAYTALGPTSFYLGQLAEARVYMEEAIALYDAQHHEVYAFVYGTNPGVVALGFAARSLCLLGYLDQARQRGHALLAMTTALASHHNSLGADLMHLVVLHLLLWDGCTAREHAEALITLATEQELPLWLSMATMLRGVALVQEGCVSSEQEKVQEGIAQARQGMVAYRATGAGLDYPHCLVLLARGYQETGQAEAGLHVLTEALAVIHSSGECYYEAEAYRLNLPMPKGRGFREPPCDGVRG